MDGNNKICNFCDVAKPELSNRRPWYIQLLKVNPNKLFTLRHRIKYRWYRLINGKKVNTTVDFADTLQPGDWVEVRSMREIAATLNNQGKYDGLYFMPEMEKFCGKKYKIVKKAVKIKLESNGQLRTLKQPGYFLEGVYCDGSFQGGCDRSCFHFWREAWLKKSTL